MAGGVRSADRRVVVWSVTRWRSVLRRMRQPRYVDNHQRRLLLTDARIRSVGRTVRDSAGTELAADTRRKQELNGPAARLVHRCATRPFERQKRFDEAAKPTEKRNGVPQIGTGKRLHSRLHRGQR